jgi:quinol monooxygenase YgiN
MYARLVRFSFGPGKRDVAKRLAKELVPLIRSQPGSESVTVFGDAEDGEYGIFALWDDVAHANAAAEIVSPRLQEIVAAHSEAPAEIRLFEVIAP